MATHSSTLAWKFPWGRCYLLLVQSLGPSRSLPAGGRGSVPVQLAAWPEVSLSGIYRLLGIRVAAYPKANKLEGGFQQPASKCGNKLCKLAATKLSVYQVAQW